MLRLHPQSCLAWIFHFLFSPAADRSSNYSWNVRKTCIGSIFACNITFGDMGQGERGQWKWREMKKIFIFFVELCFDSVAAFLSICTIAKCFMLIFISRMLARFRCSRRIFAFGRAHRIIPQWLHWMDMVRGWGASSQTALVNNIYFHFIVCVNNFFRFSFYFISFIIIMIIIRIECLFNVIEHYHAASGKRKIRHWNKIFKKRKCNLYIHESWSS